MPDVLAMLGLVAVGIFIAIGVYLIARAAVNDEMDSRGLYGTKGRPKK